MAAQFQNNASTPFQHIPTAPVSYKLNAMQQSYTVKPQPLQYYPSSDSIRPVSLLPTSTPQVPSYPSVQLQQNLLNEQQRRFIQEQQLVMQQQAQRQLQQQQLLQRFPQQTVVQSFPQQQMQMAAASAASSNALAAFQAQQLQALLLQQQQQQQQHHQRVQAEQLAAQEQARRAAHAQVQAQQMAQAQAAQIQQQRFAQQQRQAAQVQVQAQQLAQAQAVQIQQQRYEQQQRQVMAQQLQEKQFYAQQQAASQQRANANFSSSIDTVTNAGPNANGQAVGNGTISQADQTQLMLHYQQFEAASAVDAAPAALVSSVPAALSIGSTPEVSTVIRYLQLLRSNTLPPHLHRALTDWLQQQLASAPPAVVLSLIATVTALTDTAAPVTTDLAGTITSAMSDSSSSTTTPTISATVSLTPSLPTTPLVPVQAPTMSPGHSPGGHKSTVFSLLREVSLESACVNITAATPVVMHDEMEPGAFVPLKNVMADVTFVGTDNAMMDTGLDSIDSALQSLCDSDSVMPSTQSENSGSVCLTKLARSEALVSAAVDVFAFSEATLATLYSGAAAAAIFAPDWSLGHALSYMVMSALTPVAPYQLQTTALNAASSFMNQVSPVMPSCSLFSAAPSVLLRL